MATKSKQESIVFSLDTNGIEAKALSKILYETHLAFREISKEVGTDEPELRVLPFKQGSFEYVVAVGLALKGAFDLSKSVVDTFKSVIDYKKSKVDERMVRLKRKAELLSRKLKNEPLPEDSETVNKTTSDLLKTISENSGGLIIKSNTGDVIIRMSTLQIKQLIEVESLEAKKEKEETRYITRKTNLILIKTHSTPFGMWAFNYDGMRIMAEMERNYRDKHKGMRPGTKIIVDLKIWQVYNRDAKTWENKRYRVMNVNKYA